MHDIDWSWCPRVAAHEITRNFLLDGFLQRLTVVPQAIQLTREMLLFLYFLESSKSLQVDHIYSLLFFFNAM
jgi:hypothetical protein